jgi:hypothetical protein
MAMSILSELAEGAGTFLDLHIESFEDHSTELHVGAIKTYRVLLHHLAMIMEARAVTSCIHILARRLCCRRKAQGLDSGYSRKHTRTFASKIFESSMCCVALISDR